MIFLLAFAFWYILEMSLIDNTKSHLGGEIYAKNKIRKYFIHFIHVFFNGLCHDFLQHRT